MNDRFHIGSNGKAWTATVCAALVERSQISWQTTPLDVFPDIRSEIHPEFAQITLEMLLRHMAGIPPYTEDEHFNDLPALSGSPTEQRVTFAQWVLCARQPINSPGTEMAYSNAGYGIAAAMAETVSGTSWEQLIQQTICDPLGIEAGFGWPAKADANQPWGHRIKDGRIAIHPPDDDYFLLPIIAPAGDICVSLPDYGRFLQMNLSALQGRETPVSGSLLRHLHNEGQPGIGLGWGVQPIGDWGVFSVHSGSAGTFLCLAAVSHSLDRAVAIAVNGGSEDDQTFERAVAGGFKQIIANCTT
jgi:CubicO group peptidase (beta-lactamase class C family)